MKVHPVDRYVGKTIRFYRRLKKLSQIGLAEAVGVKFQQIQKYETGANRVSASRLYDIACKLQMPISYFFPDDSEESDDLSLSKEEILLLRCYRETPKEVQQRVFSLLQSTATID